MSANWPIDQLFQEPPHRVISKEKNVASILYPNEPYQGRETEVFAYLARPQSLATRAPAMICLHGGGGRAFLEFAQLWADRGYVALAMDLAGCGSDGQPLPNGGPGQSDEIKFDHRRAWTDSWTYHAVAAIIRAHSLLRGLPEVDPTRIGLTGISWGGYLTCIAAAVDPRFALAIPVYGCGFLRENWVDAPGCFAQMTPAELDLWIERADPSSYLPEAAQPMLFLSATNDFAYPVDIWEKSASLPRGPVTRSLRLDMPHSHEAGWAAPEIALFADHHFKGSPPLGSIGSYHYADSQVEADLHSPLPIREGSIVYTTDSGRWQNRVWQKKAAQLRDGRLTAPLPPATTVFYLAAEDERGAIVSGRVVIR